MNRTFISLPQILRSTQSQTSLPAISPPAAGDAFEDVRETWLEPRVIEVAYHPNTEASDMDDSSVEYIDVRIVNMAEDLAVKSN